MTNTCFYSTWQGASNAAQRLGFKSYLEYLAGYKQDSQLPCDPAKQYYRNWKNNGGWYGFLDKKNPANFYSNWQDASDAAQFLHLTSFSKYLVGYKQDPRLPSNPEKKYSKEWDKKGCWYGFLNKKKAKEFYPDLHKASAAAKHLKFTNRSEYLIGYKNDPYLPSKPEKTYSEDWKDNDGWHGFLGKPRVTPYLDWEEASAAAQLLNIKGATEYLASYKQDAHLPSVPARQYSPVWIKNGRWYGFLGKSPPPDLYSNWSEASAVAQHLNIKSYSEYLSKYKLDPCLPSDPRQIYSKDWKDNGGWYGFLGITRPPSIYSNWQEASTAAQLLGITKRSEYWGLYKQDQYLPSNPDRLYKEVWKKRGGWHGFLGQKIPTAVYSNWQDASEAAQNYEFLTSSEYQSGHKQDPRLPMNPQRIYSKEWNERGCWDGFLVKKLPVANYSQLKEASDGAQLLNFINGAEYRAGYKQDPKLPSTPRLSYRGEWNGWIDFLLPKQCNCLADVARAIQILGIKDSQDYRSQNKNYPQLPAHPERTFKNEWVDWYDLCNIPKPYSYEKSCEVLKFKKINTKSEYLVYLLESGDKHLPRTPDVVYSKEWVNWYVFLGKPEPYRLHYIHEPYFSWRKRICDFMKIAKGGSSKEACLCRFVRLYIIKNNLSQSPEKFLTLKKKDVRAFLYFLEQESENAKQKILHAVNEFLNYILKEELTLEDEETGELITVLGAKNPFAGLTVQGDFLFNTPNESTKPALAYQYVENMKFWIIPAKMNTFSDLVHLQKFDADWIEVDQKIIDKEDPDCVYKQEGSKTKLWFPVYWMLTYSLVSVPARGRQLAYNDSGEADKIIADFDGEKLIWIENKSIMAGKTTNQGFIKHYPDDQFGMNFTTNKTSNHGNGYEVAWIPELLAYWMVRLRRWQQKYNPIDQPTLWLNCKRTNLNESQLKAKGCNCFLFRDFGDQEPGFFGGKLTTRLAAALYYSQPKGVILSNLEGSSNSLSHYSSRYTPHSMRVSLITAYIIEFGLPIEIIMKIVGHSSIVMTIYYFKIRTEDLRERFNRSEKLALKNKAFAAQRMIEQNRIDEIKQELVTNSSALLQALSNETPAGNFQFRDYGICPHAGLQCDNGGELVGQTQARYPAPNGYLGMQNCLRCRHFVTGPAFLGGLLSISNEISLQANYQADQYNELDEKASVINKQIDKLDEQEYEALKKGCSFNDSQRNLFLVELRKSKSEVESAAKKLDMLLCDLHASARWIKQCQALVNQTLKKGGNNSNFQLVTHVEHEMHISFNETSRFQQLCEVCENAEIYESASAYVAVTPRSQLLDRMAVLNKLQPRLFLLDQKQQLIVGNQIAQLLLSRLKTWDTVNALIEGRIYMEDLSENEQISLLDIKTLFKHPLDSNNE